MNRKILFFIVGGVILLLLLGLALYQINQETQTRSKAAGEAVTFSFSPTSQLPLVNNNFTIDVSLDAKTNNITGVDMTLAFNTSVVDGISFQPNGNFNTELIKTINNTAGTLRFAAVNTSTSVITGIVPIGTFTLKGKALGSGDLTLQTAQVTAQGVSTALPLGTTTPATYTISSGVSPTLTSVPPTLTPTSTPTPLPPTPTPTPILPSATPTVAPPTNTPIPTSTPAPQGTTLSLDLLLHAIGLGGDNQTPGASGNFNPVNPSRIVTVSIHDENDVKLAESTGTIIFNTTNGNFTGTVSFAQPLAVGPYTVKMKTPRYLKRQAPGFIQISTQNQTGTIPVAKTTLIVGDSNGDNNLDILDFNILRDCYSDALPPKACETQEKKTSADLNDDGNVNGFDINIFIRNLTSRTGD